MAGHTATTNSTATTAPAEKKDKWLVVFWLLHIIAICAILGVIAAQVLILIFGEAQNVEFAVRIYIIVLLLLAISVELELKWFTTKPELSLFNHWPIRGFLYTFLGLLTLLFSGFDNDVAGTFCKAFGWILIGVGVVYFIMGLLRFHKKKDRHLEQDKVHREAKAAVDRAEAGRAPTHA